MSDHKVASQRLGLWCSWIFVALTAIGWLGIAHFHMPARADLGLDATKVWFSETHHWGVMVGCTLFYIAAGPAFFKSGPFPYHGLLAFYLPVIIWGAYITLTTWYMLTELRRAPERSTITEPMGRT